MTGWNDVSHCRILSPDKTEWRLISATLCGWRRCFVADQLWLMTHIREEDRRCHHSIWCWAPVSDSVTDNVVKTLLSSPQRRNFYTMPRNLAMHAKFELPVSVSKSDHLWYRRTDPQTDVPMDGPTKPYSVYALQNCRPTSPLLVWRIISSIKWLS